MRNKNVGNDVVLMSMCVVNLELVLSENAVPQSGPVCGCPVRL